MNQLAEKIIHDIPLNDAEKLAVCISLCGASALPELLRPDPVAIDFSKLPDVGIVLARAMRWLRAAQ